MSGPILWLLCLCLMILSAQCEDLNDGSDFNFSCSSNQSLVHMRFFRKEQQIIHARATCQNISWSLLDKDMFDTSRSCIVRNLKRINPAGIWIDKSDTHVSYFNMTHVNLISKDNDDHAYSSLCVKEDVVIRTFTIGPANSSKEINIDLVALECGQKKELTFTTGQNWSLKCEATGIPTPALELTEKLNGTKHFSRSKAPKQEIQIQLFRSEERITCRDVNSNTSTIISIKKYCNISNLNMSDCLADKLPYTLVEVSKLAPCEQTTATLTSRSTDVSGANSSCNETGASNCGGRPNGGTTNKNTTNSGNMNGADNRSKTTAGPAENNYHHVVIPVALATAAIVLAVCCIICVVCSVLVYRKRENIIVKLCNYARRKENSTQGKSTATDKVLEESSPFIPNGRTQTQDEQELYSTVVTVNPYHNIKSILEENCSDEQKEIIRETKFGNKDNKVYGELVDLGLSAGYPTADEYGLPSEYSRPSAPYRLSTSLGFDPSTDNNDKTESMKSTRYLSDEGLIYIITEPTGSSRPVRPIKKAVSAEHVEYTTLNFAKMHKLHLKRQKKRLADKKKSKSLPRQ